MEKQAENRTSELGSKREIDKFEYKKRFEEAVSDAQYLIIYASSNCPNDIKPTTVERLVSIRRKVENNEEISAKEEAAFWLYYQEIWNLVKPVTAESVKANLAIESTFTGRLFSAFPLFAWWFGVRPTSKAGKAANWYSFITVSLLLILIVVQAYWVIGNRLIDQLAELLQKEAEVNTQILENQRDYSALEVLYKQNEIDSESYRTSGEFTFYKSPEWERDTLENLAKKKQLETELELLKTQLERNSAILLVWSGPWDGLIQDDQDQVLIPVTGGFEEPNLTAIDEYMLQIESIQSQIDTINQYLLDDPNGEKEALSLNSKYDPEIARNEEQLGKLYAENSDLYVREAGIQSQITAINTQLDAITNGTTTIEALTNELNIQLANLRTQKSAIDQKIGEITSQLGTISDQTEEGISARSALQAQLTGLQTEQKTMEGEILNVENQLKAVSGNADTLKELNTELDSLSARKRFNNDQIQTLQTENAKLLEQRIPGGQIVIEWREEKQRLADELNSLNRQVQAEARRETSRQAQLAGTFVLVILQSYILPLLYGVLGASSFILRTLSQQIKDVTFSEENRVQNPVRISLGALAGIMVGFLLPTDEATSFLGSVSPLALAFLVGYNIDFFFAIMDFSLSKLKGILEKPADKETSSQMASHVGASTETAEVPEEYASEEAIEEPVEPPSEQISDKQ
jgi:predicted  nucleic acid-binding Zn-ribbon protein